MTRPFVRRLALLALAAPFVWAADPLPSAESILDRFVEVTGGRAAYENITSEIVHGTVEFPAAGLKGTVTTYSAGSDYYMVIDLPGAGKLENGIRDRVAWERSDLLGPRIKTGTERSEAIRASRLDAAVQWREIYPKVEAIGEDSVNGEACYQVRKTPPEGHPEVSCYSKDSGLELRMTTTVTHQMGEVPGETLASGYKEFGGILIPTVISMKAVGQDYTILTEKVETNPEIPASRFALPPDIEALLKNPPQ